MNTSLLWLVLAVFMSVLEALTTQLVSIWFVLSSLVCLMLSIFGVPLDIQVFVFILLSLILLFSTRTIAKRILSFEKTRTNCDRYLGKIGTVISDIDNLRATGVVKVLGTSWTASSVNNNIIKKGENVRVEKIEGVKVIVSHIKEN